MNTSGWFTEQAAHFAIGPSTLNPRPSPIRSRQLRSAVIRRNTSDAHCRDSDPDRRSFRPRPTQRHGGHALAASANGGHRTFNFGMTSTGRDLGHEFTRRGLDEYFEHDYAGAINTINIKRGPKTSRTTTGSAQTAVFNDSRLKILVSNTDADREHLELYFRPGHATVISTLAARTVASSLVSTESAWISTIAHSRGILAPAIYTEGVCSMTSCRTLISAEARSPALTTVGLFADRAATVWNPQLSTQHFHHAVNTDLRPSAVASVPRGPGIMTESITQQSVIVVRRAYHVRTWAPESLKAVGMP